jgi:hypothetical protein
MPDTHTRRTRYHVLQDTEQICCDIHGSYRLQQMGQTHTWKALYHVHFKTRNDYALAHTDKGTGHTCTNKHGQNVMLTLPLSV